MPNAFTLTPITVDGLDLSTYAFGITAKTKQVLGRRSADQTIAGVDGTIASLNDDFDESLLTLSMYVRGANPTTGIIPANSIAQVRANLDELLFAFSKTHALLDVREDVDGAGTIHQAYCKTVVPITPKMQAGASGEFEVLLTVPSVFWQDLTNPDWTSTPTLVSGNTYEVTTLQGGTAPIADSTILVTGPVTNPRVTDFGSNSYVQLNAALTAGQSWRINNATWATRYGAGLGLGSADTTGTDGSAVTQYGGAKNQFLRLTPTLVSGLRRVQLTVSGTGFTAATAVAVRARRKYLH